ncbi:MAG: PAS domain-containing sensor histidine kinase [Nitrospiraceae bacterium]
MSSTDHLPELESLRSQVAELSRALADRDQSMRAQSHHLEEMMQDLREQSHLLRTIIEGTAAETGDEFFASLVTHLTSTLHVHYAVIGEVIEGRHKKIRTLAVSAGGTLVDNFEYELAHTPCATALTETFACIDRDVQARFPQFRRLADLGAEGYCGVSLRTKGGAVIGLLIVMDTKPLQQGDYLHSLLGVLAPRAVAEFERRRADQERAQALADLHNVMETVPDVMFTLDTQGNMVKWNRRAVDVTGYSPEELLNKPALAFVPLEEQIRTAAAIQRAFAEGYAELDGHLLTKEHHLIPYHWTGALLKNPHGEPIGITGIGRDVSDMKRAEEELRQQRHHLVAAQALAHLGSWDWDIDTGEVEWSDEQFRIFGYEPGAIAVTYDRFLASLHPDDHAPVLAAINDMLLGKCPCDVEYRIVRPNGEVRSIHARGDVHRDATGHPRSMTGTVLDITDRKRAEEALRAGEARFRTLAESTTDWMWEINEHGVYTYCSSKMRDLLGYEPDEALGKTPFDFMPEEEARRVADLFGPIAAARKPFAGIENTNRRKDGRLVVLECRGVPIIDANGVFRGYCGFDQDITERKRTEEALRESEQRLGAILTNSPNMIFLKDLDGRYLYANKVFSDWLHLDPQVMIGKTDVDLFEPDQARRFRQHDQQVVQEGTAHSFEEMALHADGQHTSIVVKFPLTDSAGQIYATGGVVTDITARKRAEDAIREAELRYRAIFEQAGAGVAQVESRTGQFVQVNRQYCEILGLTEAEMLGNTVGAITHPDDLERDLESMTRLLSGEISSFTMEKRYVRKDGSIVWVNLNVAPLWWPGEPPVHHIAIVQDITDRKRMEEALRQRERDLRAAVEERERISQDLHDGILQSLFAVGLTLETAKSMMSPRNRKTSGLPIDQAIDQLNRVMHEIRNFIAGLGSDLLKGKDLPTALRHMLKSLTQDHVTRVRLAVEDRAAQALSAEQSLHLFLVIQEAVSNCIKHGRAHEATVSLKMLKQGVRLSIRDNGSGFNPEATRRTGRGLVNMAARAQKIGGRFTVFSRINEGTRVVFDLPKDASFDRR